MFLVNWTAVVWRAYRRTDCCFMVLSDNLPVFYWTFIYYRPPLWLCLLCVARANLACGGVVKLHRHAWPHTPLCRHSMQQLFETLGLEPSVTLADIKAAYRCLAKKYHPDKNRSAEATALFQQLNYAYNILTNIGAIQKNDYVPNQQSDNKLCYISLSTKENTLSVTIDIVDVMLLVFIEECKAYHGVSPTHRGQHGLQLYFAYTSPDDSETYGSISLTFYPTTARLLVQGSSYLLWVDEHMPVICARAEHNFMENASRWNGITKRLGIGLKRDSRPTMSTRMTRASTRAMSSLDATVSTVPVSPIPDATVSTVPVSSISDATVSTVPVSSISDATVSTVPVSSLSDATVSTVSVSSISDATVFTVPVSSISDATVSTVPVSSISDATVYTVPVSSISDANVSTVSVSSISDATVSTVPVSSISDATVLTVPVSSISDATVSTVPVSSISDATVFTVRVSYISDAAVYTARVVHIGCHCIHCACVVHIGCHCVHCACVVNIGCHCVHCACVVHIGCHCVHCACVVHIGCRCIHCARVVHIGCHCVHCACVVHTGCHCIHCACVVNTGCHCVHCARVVHIGCHCVHCVHARWYW